MQKLIWGVLLLLLMILEIMVARKPLPVVDLDTAESLHDYWKDQSPENEIRWEQAKAAAELRLRHARAARTAILLFDGLCIAIVGFLLVDAVRAERAEQASKLEVWIAEDEPEEQESPQPGPAKPTPAATT